MSIQLVRSTFHPSWVEVREGPLVLREIEVLFPLKRLPNQSFFTAEEAVLWLQTAERKLAKTAALRCLARQALPSTILHSKLRQKGYAESVCQDILVECQPYLADDELWQRTVERELEKGYGPRWIEWKWKARGLPEGLVGRIATREKQRACIRRAYQKMRGKGERKALQALLKRGFDADLVFEETRS